MSKLLSDDGLRAEIANVLLLDRQTMEPYVSVVDDLINLVNTQKRLYAESELEKFKVNNHIGYAYGVGEVTENYIVLDRVVKKGKNWVLRVQCRWCGNEMNRMTNKFKVRHIDCKEWGVHMRLSAEQRARIK
jgi:hypothetical protein